jgi:dolichol-phosphate mannosyltransferase
MKNVNNPFISIVISFRNEADVLEELIRRIKNSIYPLNCKYEMIFVNDASTDASLDILKQKTEKDSRIKVINMSRCFGQAECVLAGFSKSRGDRIIYMDADLQDPPEIIPELIQTYEKESADVVYTTRLSRSGENFAKLMITQWAYRIIQKFSSVDIPVDSGDFKILSRQVVDHLIAMKEQGLYMRGLISWLGFKQVPFYYHRESRFSGQSKFPILTSKGPMVSFLRALTSFSLFPLYSVIISGLILLLISLLIVFLCLGLSALNDMFIPFWIYIILSITAMGGIQLIAIGIIGLYIAQIHLNTLSRPRYIIESTINLNENQ